MFRIAFAFAAGIFAGSAAVYAAGDDRLTFRSIDGGTLDLSEFRGGPVLVVNTASRCGYTRQYEGLQALWEAYRDQGLTVVGVPSDSFWQELGTADEVKDFCEVNFSIDFPMTDLEKVRGASAHPFYRWAAAKGAVPGWNFYKILLDGDGNFAGSFGTRVKPSDPRLRDAIEDLLPAS
jgi:glutathione peroxidase